mmetsp:Transcript_42942/g.81899  ORF Transcript_42942/g.81899 Transcript_42942/m.81899 type:complete len:221 (-) Transcript_42942:353-1015(-)
MNQTKLDISKRQIKVILLIHKCLWPSVQAESNHSCLEIVSTASVAQHTLCDGIARNEGSLVPLQRKLFGRDNVPAHGELAHGTIVHADNCHPNHMQLPRPGELEVCAVEHPWRQVPFGFISCQTVGGGHRYFVSEQLVRAKRPRETHAQFPFKQRTLCTPGLVVERDGVCEQDASNLWIQDGIHKLQLVGNVPMLTVGHQLDASSGWMIVSVRYHHCQKQ